jgi:hypothetical protein
MRSGYTDANRCLRNLNPYRQGRSVERDDAVIGKIQRVPLREVWKHEALDFTTWLRENIDVVSDVVSVPLDEAEREQSAGNFSVDLVARDSSGDPVVIENQLEKSDHNHLGKLLTYLVAFEAKTAIWIVSEPRPEHLSTITWLNESSPASFYLLKVEAIKIVNSPPAPLLTLVVGPSEEGREVGKKKKELAEQDTVMLRFWIELLDKVQEKTSLHATISPKRSNWLIDSAGVSGLSYGYVVRKSDARVELYIDRGGDGEENKGIFDALATDRDTIEAAFGDPLDWQRRDNAVMCKIQKRIDVGGYADESRWADVQEAMIDAMIRLEKAFKPYIRKLAA